MSEEYYEKDGKLSQKGDFIFPDKEVGEFEKNWDGTSSVKDWLNNEIATQSKPDWFDETDVTVHGQEGHFSEPGILDLSGNRPFTPDPEEAAPSEPDSTSASTPSESSGGGYSYGGSSTPPTKSVTSSDELTFGQAFLLALLIVAVGALCLRVYGFEKADKEVKAFLSEVFQPPKPPTQNTQPPKSVTRSFTPHDSQQRQAEPKSDGKLHNPLDNKEFMDGIHNFLRGDGKSSNQPNARTEKNPIPEIAKPKQAILTIGIPAGTYVHPAVVNGKYGRLTTTSDFTVEGDRFTFLHRENFSPSTFGIRNGRINYPFSYTVRWHGIVKSIGSSSYVFKPSSVQLVNKSPSRLPFSATHVPTARELPKFTWTFVYAGGRLRERDTGKVWNNAR